MKYCSGLMNNGMYNPAASVDAPVASLFQCAVDAQDFNGEVNKTHPATFAPPVAAGADALGNERG